MMAKVYFTPWNTAEVWEFDDFHGQNRIWLAKAGNPTRVFIHKDSLPVTDITDTIPDGAFLKQIDGLAYAIPFIEPDTFNWDEPDTTDYGDPGSLSWSPCPLRKEFTAMLSNIRLFTWYTPPNGVNTQVWLKNATVEVHVDRWPDSKIAVLRTNNDGYIIDGTGRGDEIILKFCAGINRSSIGIWLEVLMEDPFNKNQLRVKMAKSTKHTHSFLTNKQGLGYSNSNPNISHYWGSVLADDWREIEIPQEDLGLTYTMIGWAFDYTNRELQGTGQELGPNLKVKVKANKTVAETNTLGIPKVINLGMQQRQEDEPPAYIREGTIFHEFGHYLFGHLYGNLNWASAGGTHSRLINNRNSQLTMSEGVANGFAGIMDEMTWNILGQSSNERLYHQRPFFRNDGTNVRLNHPFLSEHYLASVMLDLWDGTQNYITYNDINPDGPEFMDFGVDNFEMSFKDICRPFWEHKGSVNSIEEYFDYLVENASCNQKNSIARIFQFNSEDIELATITNAADFPVFNTDEIYRAIDFNVTGFKMKNNGDLKQRTTNFIHSRSFQTLTGENNSYNVTRFEQIHNSTINWYRNIGDVSLTDNLTVLDNATLQIHGNQTPRFYNNIPPSTTYNQYNEHLNVNLCQGTLLTIGNEGNLEIGSISPYRTANLFIKNGSVLDLRPGSTLLINNNSKLTIEPGATLIIHPGAQIILNGPNAVLHIKGKIILEQNADFNPVAGANGFGQLIVENHTGEFQIESKGNNKIIIDPITKPTINTQYNLIVIGEKGLHTGETYQISEFRINNANVLIKDNSLITSKAFRFNVFNSNIYGEQNLNSKGLLAFESLCNINNCRFEYLNSAFTYFLLNGIYAQQEIRNSQFIKCKTSINMNGANVKVKNCLFNWFGRYGDIGIRSLSSGGGDVFLDNTFQLPSNPFNNNISKSLQYVGKDAKIYRNIFVDGNVAIDNKDGNLFLECNNFQSWTFRELSHNAINSKNGALYLNTGRNLFAHYKTYLNTNNSRLFLNNGSNLFLLGNPSQYFFKCDLEYRSAVNNIQLSSNHSVSPASYNTYAFLATGNYWRESYPALPSHFRPIPATSNPNMNFGFLSGTNYDLGYLPAMTTSSNYIEVQNSYCSPKYTDIELQRPFGDINDILYMDRIPSELTLPTSNPIKPNSINDNLYLDALLSSIEKANQDTVNYFEVMPEIIYLTKLKLPDTLSDFSYFTYNLIHRIYHHSLYDSTKSDSVLNIHKSELGNLLLSAQDSFILKSFSNDSFWLSLRYELLRDKAEVLRILNRRTVAITLLDSAIVDPEISNLKKSHATTWRCFINQEQQFLDSQIEVSELNFSLCLPEDSIFIHNPYTIVAVDTSFTICIPDTSNIQSVSIKYTPIDTILPYTMYDEFLDTFPLTTTHEYDLTVGKYTLTAIDTINNIFFSTSINIEGIEEKVIDSTESYYIDCETAYLPYNVSSDSTRVYNQWNVLQDSVLFNYYELDGVNNEYRVEYKNTSTCKILKTRLDIDDILTAPPSTPNTLLLAKYDRTVDSCAFVKLNNITCNGDSIDFGKTLEIYDENLQYQFTTSVELYGTQTKGFKFCPPYWNTDEEHIANWNALIYKIGVCNYCRIDFKADSFINFPKVLSVQENETKPNITLYPNPTSKEVNIELLTPINEPITIVMFDVMGKEVKRINVDSPNKNPVKCSVEHLSAGVYHIYIPQLGYAKKLIVMKEE